MLQPIFISGIGTHVGKTIVSAIIAEALHADYWKPVQAGSKDCTDGEWVRASISNNESRIHPETYHLQLAASPHIAAREEGLRIDLDVIAKTFKGISNQESEIRPRKRVATDRTSQILYIASDRYLIIEGAGGLLAPLNENEFAIDLVKKLEAKVILVSRNYLGSINHSLLTSSVCRQNGINVIGWVFNDQYLSYEDEIVKWSGFPKIFSIPYSEKMEKLFISQQAEIIRSQLMQLLLQN
jgi:dethiobiotin synthetase